MFLSFTEHTAKNMPTKAFGSIFLGNKPTFVLCLTEDYT